MGYPTFSEPTSSSPGQQPPARAHLRGLPHTHKASPLLRLPLSIYQTGMMVTGPLATASFESVASACSAWGAPCLFPHVPSTSDHNRSNPPWEWQNLPTPVLAAE